MRGPLRQAIFAQFKRELGARMPYFQLVSESSASIWTWRFDSSLTFFVLMDAAENQDVFYVEVAWSENGDFPWTSIGKTNTGRQSGRARLGRQGLGGKLQSWDLAPEKTERIKEDIVALREGKVAPYPADSSIEDLLPRISPMIRDAVDELERHGIPLFRQVAEARGLHLPTI